MKFIITLLILAFSVLPVDAKPKKVKNPIIHQAAPPVADSDWIWESGSYIAIWPGEVHGSAWIVGPEFPDGIEVLQNGLNPVQFKRAMKLLVDALGQAH